MRAALPRPLSSNTAPSLTVGPDNTNRRIYHLGHCRKQKPSLLRVRSAKLDNILLPAGANVTGVAALGKVLVAKRFELLRELVPKAEAIAFLVNPDNSVADLDTRCSSK